MRHHGAAVRLRLPVPPASRAAGPGHAHRGVGRGDRRQMGHRLADRELRQRGAGRLRAQHRAERARHRAVWREMHAVAAFQDRREGRPQRLSAHRRQRQQGGRRADPGPAGDRGDGARGARGGAGHARPARGRQSRRPVAGRRRCPGDAPRLGQYRHDAGRREDQHAAGRLRARGRFPPARRHQPRRGAGQGRGDRRAPSRRQLRGTAARRPGSHRLRSDARDDGPSPAPRRRGPGRRRRSRSSASAAPIPASGASRAYRPSSTAAHPPAWAASTKASASPSSIM